MKQSRRAHNYLRTTINQIGLLIRKSTKNKIPNSIKKSCNHKVLRDKTRIRKAVFIVIKITIFNRGQVHAQ